MVVVEPLLYFEKGLQRQTRSLHILMHTCKLDQGYSTKMRTGMHRESTFSLPCSKTLQVPRWFQCQACDYLRKAHSIQAVCKKKRKERKKKEKKMCYTVTQRFLWPSSYCWRKENTSLTMKCFWIHVVLFLFCLKSDSSYLKAFHDKEQRHLLKQI